MHELENIETYSYMNICKKHDPTSYVKSVCGKCDDELQQRIKELELQLDSARTTELKLTDRIAELENITGVDFKFVDYEDYKKMMQERDRLKEAINKLANIANDLAICGPFENHKFVGCKLYQSDDPMEICLRCEILSLQQTIKEK